MRPKFYLDFKAKPDKMKHKVKQFYKHKRDGRFCLSAAVIS